VLRQNRRVVKGDDGDTAERKEELEVFHKILSDVSMGIASERTRTFLTQAYVRGALHCATADHAELEGNTSVFRAPPSLHLRLGPWTRHWGTYPARPRCSPRGARALVCLQPVAIVWCSVLKFSFTCARMAKATVISGIGKLFRALPRITITF